jgi:hypothetical protein
LTASSVGKPAGKLAAACVFAGTLGFAVTLALAVCCALTVAHSISNNGKILTE